jgi:transcriptional regulator with XRE-family HTH domain
MTKPHPVRKLRTALALSQFRLAAAAGVHPSTVSNLERFGFITRATAEKLAPVLGVSPEYLLGEGE